MRALPGARGRARAEEGWLLAVESGLFPLYEVFNGCSYRINHEPEWIDPADSRQRRLPKGSIDLDAVRRECRENYDRLKVLAEQFPAQG